MGFPVERWRILVAKNLASITLRLPSVLTLLVASAVLVYLTQVLLVLHRWRGRGSARRKGRTRGDASRGSTLARGELCNDQTVDP